MTRKRLRRIALVAVAAAGLGACAPGGVFPTPAFDNPVDNPGAIVEAADWDIAETITVDIRQSEFNPSIIRLFQGEPYVIVLENRDDVIHTFAAPGFFRTAAIRKIVTEQEELTPERIGAIVLEPGTIKEVHLVPVRDGWYPFEGGSPGILLDTAILSPLGRGSVYGMVGRIIVEP